MTTDTSPPGRQRPGLISGARIMVVGTTLSRLTGYGRILALGYALGFNRVGDAYNLANTTPNIVYDLVLGGVLSGTLVPVFVAAVGRDRSEPEDWDAVSAVFTVTAAALIVLSIAFFVAVPALIHVYTLGVHDPGVVAERKLAIDLLYLFVPQLFLYGAVTLMTAVLNARREFAAPAFAPVVANVVTIGVLLAIPNLIHPVTVDRVLQDGTARSVLGLGTTMGVALTALVMLPYLRQAAPHLRIRWRPDHPAVRTVLRLSGWTAAYVAANQVALFIVTVLANRRAGDLSAYQAAYVFFLLPHGIFAVSIMSAMEPDLAHEWAARRLDACRYHLLEAIRLAAAIIVPAALGYAVLARPVVRLLLQHGALRADVAATTADVLAIMALGLPGFSLYLLLMRAYQAMQDTRAMFVTYLVENGLNIAFAFLLYPRFGVVGLAGALSLAYVGGAVVALMDVRRRLGGLHGDRIVIVLYRVAVAAAITADVALAVSVLLAKLLGAGRGVALVVRVVASVGVGVTVYVRVAGAFGIHEVRSLLQVRRRPT